MLGLRLHGTTEPVLWHTPYGKEIIDLAYGSILGLLFASVLGGEVIEIDTPNSHRFSLALKEK
jgi:hypothetical protein